MLRAQRLDLDTLLEAIDRLDSVFALYDRDFRLIFANKAATNAWPELYSALARGLPQYEAICAEIRQQLPDATEAEILQATDYTVAGVNSYKASEITARGSRIFRILHERLGDRGIVGIGVDLTNLRKNQEKLEALAVENHRLANIDELTGLANRRSFLRELDSLLESDVPRFSLGILDLDGFKPVNDAYGHPVGDRLLAEAATRVKEVVGEQRMIARLGGDEFAFLFEGAATDENLSSAAKRLCTSLSKAYRIDDKHLSVTASIGIATFPDAGTDRSSLLTRADYALYQAKQAGKGQVVSYSSEHDRLLHQEASLELSFRRANFAKEMDVEFQPLLEAETGRVVVMESLARWNCPTHGRVAPDQFIPLAEKTGRIGSLSQALLEKALLVAKHWPREYSLSFNLSSLELADRQHVEALVEMVRASGVAIERVILEVTERAFTQDAESVVAALELLRSHGLRIALDDFGSSQSNLASIAQMPLDIVKVDGAFLENVQDPDTRVALLKTVCDLCQTLGIETVIEAVETESQHRQAKLAGANLVQGFFCCPPLTSGGTFQIKDSARKRS
ncbi:MAG: EAL domain-containing protein [Pseudomonadota bacterium]